MSELSRATSGVITGEFRHAQPVSGGPEILTGIAESEADALAALAQPGSYVLETGSAYGYSALVMAAEGAHVLTIDSHAGVNEDSLSILDQNVRACCLRERVFPLTGDSEDVLRMLSAVGAEFDGVFVDGGAESTAVDVSEGWGMLRPGGWLARHDYGEARSQQTTDALDWLFPQGPDELVRTLWIKRK